MGLGALATGLVAALVGMPTLRLRGHYLAMGTLGLGAIIQIVFNQADQITEGPSGITAIPYLSLAGLPLSTDHRCYFLVWPRGRAHRPAPGPGRRRPSVPLLRWPGDRRLWRDPGAIPHLPTPGAGGPSAQAGFHLPPRPLPRSGEGAGTSGE